MLKQTAAPAAAPVEKGSGIVNAKEREFATLTMPPLGTPLLRSSDLPFEKNGKGGIGPERNMTDREPSMRRDETNRKDPLPIAPPPRAVPEVPK